MIYTSSAVLDELKKWNNPIKDRATALLNDIPILQIEAPILEIVQTYIKNVVMPKDPSGDALHLAIASYHKCDFLLTWNCNHLANANKFRHIQRINTLMGLYIPNIVTPLELLGQEF
jgi:hypothetical protein